MSSPTAAVLGEIGLPVPIRELAVKTWDVIVVGAGHNGLACAAYLAQAGKRVLVIESRARVGGACTIEEPFPGVRMSPCAYLAGLLHPLVVEELELPRAAFNGPPPSTASLFPSSMAPAFSSGMTMNVCEAEVRALSPDDVEGWNAMNDVIRRLRDALRPPGDDDLWIGEAPTREQIEERLGNDEEARAVLFDWSMAEFVERYLDDERLQIAYLGQGVIGTNASPFDPGTASIRFHHASGRLGGMPGMWGYVRGGMGMVSFYFCDAAREAGATVVVRRARCAASCPAKAWCSKAASASLRAPSSPMPIPCRRCAARRHRRSGLARAHRADSDRRLHREAQRASARAAQLHRAAGHKRAAPLRPDQCAADEGRVEGRLCRRAPRRAARTSVVRALLPERARSFRRPDGRAHHERLCAVRAVSSSRDGTWDERRDEVRKLALNSLARFCSNIDTAVIDAQVLGPPDIEQKVGLTGGHIFQGECLPPYMWANRLTARTPMPGSILRSMHASRRQRDRHQRAQRRHGGAQGPQ